MDFKTDVSLRKNTLKKLLITVTKYQQEIVDALYLDFKKSEFEAILTETSYVVSDLKNTIKNISNWAKPEHVFPTLVNFPSSDYILREPYGKVLIIAPWNYPYQLALCPLIAGVAAGNQIVLKPSELTVNTSKIIAKIVSEVFDKNHVEVVQGGTDVSTKLLAQRWDYIFFTGSVPVGKIVAKAAATFLTPVTLELGGKNPCIVNFDAHVKLTAKRIVWGKFLNAGQTCIAPDYLLVHHKIKTELVAHLKLEIELAYGKNPEISTDFPRIVNEKNWSRLTELLEKETILFGGDTNKNDKYIAPTLLDESKLDSLVMKDEIFGPILPIISYKNETEIESIIAKYEKPLSLYVFSTNTNWAKNIMKKYSFGGGSINDTIIHFSNSRLPFGGVGNSGIGAYHGKLSFDAFSHKKSIVKKGLWLDLPLRYAPYSNKLKNIKQLLNWI
ncbi:MAG: aldehyde dehydrogenase [Flavobacterium sp.]|nr:aldehyde dehydrogenase [Flavobacterium sp.]